MAAKSKASKNNDTNHASLESNKNTELEKKVDALLSVEPVEPKSKTTPSAPLKNEPPASEDSVAGVPLLPDDALPIIEKPSVSSAKPADEPAPAGDTPLLPNDLLPEEVVEEPQKIKFYESLGPKPVAPEKFQDDLGLEDIGTGKAVDEIIATEADELIEARDSRFARADPPTPKKKRSFFKSKRFWYMFIMILLLAIGVTAAVPNSRYAVLNAAGVRSAASVTILDETTGQPLKNAEFAIDGTSAQSDKEGVVRLDNLTLGNHELRVKKAAFAEVTRSVTLGWGSNPLGEFKLKPVGTQYRLSVTDFLSKKPIAKVEASSGEASALSNEKGEIVITIPRAEADKENATIILKGENLREEKRTIALGTENIQPIEMVPARKHAFISKRSGTYDVYKIDVDGKNEQKVLSGTGSEKPEAMALSINPSKNVAALVSTRGNAQDSTLTLVDLETNKSKKVAESERLQMVGWIDDKLAYVKIAAGEKADSPSRHRLIAYTLSSGSERELASVNYFNDIMQVGKSIYYAPASYNGTGTIGLFKTNIDGNDKRTVYDKEIWNLFRTSFDELSISMGQEWYTLNLSNDTLSKASGPPPMLQSRVYVANATGSDNLWTEERDGKTAVLDYQTEPKADKILQSRVGIKNPVRWLTATDIIYRISNSQETADYIMSTQGGESRKIKDVTDTAGIDRWYYY